jgi:hypothetical protein
VRENTGRRPTGLYQFEHPPEDHLNHPDILFTSPNGRLAIHFAYVLETSNFAHVNFYTVRCSSTKFGTDTQWGARTKTAHPYRLHSIGVLGYPDSKSGFSGFFGFFPVFQVFLENYPL